MRRHQRKTKLATATKHQCPQAELQPPALAPRCDGFAFCRGHILPLRSAMFSRLRLSSAACLRDVPRVGPLEVTYPPARTACALPRRSSSAPAAALPRSPAARPSSSSCASSRRSIRVPRASAAPRPECACCASGPSRRHRRRRYRNPRRPRLRRLRSSLNAFFCGSSTPPCWSSAPRSWLGSALPCFRSFTKLLSTSLSAVKLERRVSSSLSYSTRVFAPVAG